MGKWKKVYKFERKSIPFQGCMFTLVCQNIKVACHLFLIFNLVIILLIVIFFNNLFFIICFFNFVPNHLVLFDFYIKFDLHSFDWFFFYHFLIEFFFNLIPQHLILIYFYLKFGLHSSYCYLFWIFFFYCIFLISSLNILLIENFALLFFIVCLLWDLSQAHD